MAGPKATFYLPPNFDLVPTGPPHLGQILCSLEDPANAINKSGPEPLASHGVQEYANEQKIVSHSWEDTYEQSTSFFFNAVQMIAAKVGMEFANTNHRTVATKIGRLETRYFVPTNAYVHTGFLREEVQEWLKSQWFRKRIFMVTGLKVAYPNDDSVDSVTYGQGQTRKHLRKLKARSQPAMEALNAVSAEPQKSRISSVSFHSNPSSTLSRYELAIMVVYDLRTKHTPRMPCYPKTIHTEIDVKA